jgi:hypothetical protein
MRTVLLRRETSVNYPNLFSCQPGSLPTPSVQFAMISLLSNRGRESEREGCPYKRFSNPLVHPLGYVKAEEWGEEEIT